MFVIMKTIGSESGPVAIRGSFAAEQQCCTELAKDFQQQMQGEIEEFDGGASVQSVSAAFTWLEVLDCNG